MAGPTDILQIAYMLTIFTIDPNSGIDDRLILMDVMTSQDCQERAAIFNSKPARDFDDEMGKPIMFEYFGCSDVMRGDIDRMSRDFSDVLLKDFQQYIERETR